MIDDLVSLAGPAQAAALRTAADNDRHQAGDDSAVPAAVLECGSRDGALSPKVQADAHPVDVSPERGHAKGGCGSSSAWTSAGKEETGTSFVHPALERERTEGCSSKDAKKTDEELAELLEKQEKDELEAQMRKRKEEFLASEQLARQLQKEEEDDARAAAASSASKRQKKQKARADEAEIKNSSTRTQKDAIEEDIPQSMKDALLDQATKTVLGKRILEQRIANYFSSEEEEERAESDEQIALRLQAEEDKRDEEVLCFTL